MIGKEAKFLVKALMISGALMMGTAAVAQEAATPRIEVTGQGEVRVAPDMAVISLGVVAEAESSEDALRDMSQAQEQILAQLTDLGIAPEQVQTTGLRLTPMYSNASSLRGTRISGFSASTMVNVQVMDLENLGDVLGAVVSEGANQMQGLQFDLQDRSGAMAEARRAAVLDARLRAETYAEAAGVELGDLLVLREGGAGHAPMPMAMARMESVSVPVAEGEIVISADVSVVYGLE